MNPLLRILFLCIVSTLAACVSVTNPTTQGTKMSKADAIRTIAPWPAPGTQILDVPEAKQNPEALPFSARVTHVDEGGLTYSCSFGRTDSPDDIIRGSTITTTYYRMKPGPTARLDFSNVRRIEHYKSTLGTGWTWVALFDASGRKLIRFFCETHDRAAYAQQVRSTEALAAAFAALCPNAR